VHFTRQTLPDLNWVHIALFFSEFLIGAVVPNREPQLVVLSAQVGILLVVLILIASKVALVLQMIWCACAFCYCSSILLALYTNSFCNRFVISYPLSQESHVVEFSKSLLFAQLTLVKWQNCPRFSKCIDKYEYLVHCLWLSSIVSLSTSFSW